MNFLGIFLAQNDRLVVGYMGTEIFEFQPNFSKWQLFKEGNRQGILADFFSNHHNLGLEWTFWTFSVLKMIVLSLAI